MNTPELIHAVRTTPLKPILENLLHEAEIAGLHGTSEVFKTMFVLQLADALASGTAFLGTWACARPCRVFLFETEMSVQSLGTRVQKMYANTPAPTNVFYVSTAELRKFQRAPNLLAKFALLSKWIEAAQPDVLIVDTANPCFRGKESANDENSVGAFMDMLSALPCAAKMFVRHNRKPRDNDDPSDASSRIRGSGQWYDVPDVLMELRRRDKRTNEAVLSVTKYRHGSKAEDISVWFDMVAMRLIPLPPPISLLLHHPLTRADIHAGMLERFGIKTRTADGHIAQVRPVLREGMLGHNRVFEIDWQAAEGAEVDWYKRAVNMTASEGSRGCGVVEVQGSRSVPTHPLPPASPLLNYEDLFAHLPIDRNVKSVPKLRRIR